MVRQNLQYNVLQPFNIFKALQAVYPDYIPTTKPFGYWKDKGNQKKFFDQFAIKWNIQTPEDWNKVTNQMVAKEGGNFIYSYYNGSLQLGNNLSCSFL
jgi:hypothetical protein